MVSRHYFDLELESLHQDLVEMGSKVQESIDNAINALKNQDVELSRQVFKNDDIIDELEHKIERKCINLIARQQPLAKDLRSISTALKIITDMERIADHSADICELTIKMADQKYIKPLIDIPKMAEAAKKMVNNAIHAYVTQNVELAEKVCADDDIVDDYFVKVVDELRELIRENPDVVYQATNFILVAKYLERMGDHATNISEWVIYNVTGVHKDLNHDDLTKIKVNK
ncbi:MAG: phosphate transport system protein [Clostridiales bacterium]|jgi:phosphate transport system protein|nr:phosphate transport system protein [Clostridiales bacterium]